jgi:Asp-tRNA(Asn)/Glu-tRNA(Gln) amidotransferase A subunit family amidase
MERQQPETAHASDDDAVSLRNAVLATPPPASAEITGERAACSRKKPFRFDREAELALLQQVTVSVPWEAGYGDVCAAWDTVAERLRSAGHEVDGRRARAKTDAMLKAWRQTCAREEKLSGVDVPYGEKESLLEDLRARFDDWSSKEKESADRAGIAKAKLDMQGKELRSASMMRMKRLADAESEEIRSDDESASRRTFRKKRSRSLEDSFECIKEGFLSNSQLREREIILAEKRLQLDEKRLELEKEERDAARQLQNKTMNAMLEIVKTLSDRADK